MDAVPTIDLQRPDAGALAALDRACRDHGFFLIAGHGMDEVIERTWQETRRFFAAPPALKQAIRRREDRPLGYYDRELTKRRRDCKEVFDFMEPEGPVGRRRNRWPEQASLPDFREALVAFFEEASAVAEETLRLVHSALELPADAVARHGGSRTTSTVRLNHYPVGDPVAAGERGGLAELGKQALGHHTDPGVLTLLLQDDTGGLQTHSREGTGDGDDDGWIDVPPSPGTIVVNLADSLQVQTNDRYRAALHRVVPMRERHRYSIPYFYNPALEAVIEPIDALCEGAPHYRAFTWREFIQARIDDNFSDLGSEDTQASHFRIA